jgi:hypothetical protein
MKNLIRAFTLCLLIVPGAATADVATQHMNHVGNSTEMTHNMHDMHGGAEQAMPTEPGQGAFAAIAEIVAMLAADPATDWQAVDITTLRDHLVDMDLLVTETQVTAREVADGLEMTIAVPDRSRSAALRMVPEHAPFLADETGWKSRVTDAGDALVWTVTDPQATAQIRALGFFGLMATGNHHHQHHLAIATGRMVH